MNNSDPIIVLSKNFKEIALTANQIQWLEDQSHQLSFDQILTAPYQQKFTQIPELNMGFSSSTHWVKIKLKNDEAKAREVVLELANLTQYVTFFYPSIRGKQRDWTVTKLGLLNSEFKQRDIQRPYSAIRLTMPGNSIQEVYLKLKSTSVQVPLHVYNQSYFRNNIIVRQSMFYFIIYGILIAMIIYNLFIFFVIKDKIYLIYIIMMLMSIILSLISSGYYLYMLPYTYFFKTYNDTIVVVSMLSQLVFGIILLDFKRIIPWLYKTILVLIAIDGIFFLLSLWSNVMALLVPCMMLNLILAVTLSLLLYLRGVKIARFILVAILFTTIGFGINLSHILGFLPTTNIIHLAPALGVALEAIFFSFALSDKIGFIRQERYLAQKALLVSTQENERLMTQQNEILAQRVEEKTEELRFANEMLISSNDFLQNSQEEIATQRDFIQEKNEELEANQQKILQLNQFKQQMMGMIVHDLKNPLNSIIGLSEEAQNNAHLETINHSGKRMHHLVMNILDVQKLEDSQVSLNKETISLSNLMEVAVPQIEFVTQANNQSVVVSQLPDVVLEIDVELLSRVIVNLLTNASKYSPQNEQIHIHAEATDGICKISVIDTGVGIAPEFLSQVFDKFAQAKGAQAYRHNSTGLGLTFCKLVIEAHNGEIGVKSEPNQGSTFWFTLPCVINSASTVTTALKPNIQTENYHFTSEELAILNPIVAQIKACEIYETGKIKKLLAELNTQPSDALRDWKDKLEAALLADNEGLFNELLQL